MTAENMSALQHPISGIVVVVLVDYLRQHQAWGWLRLMGGGRALQGVPGLTFAKVMGSGHAGGFSLRPSASHQGLICCFDGWTSAVNFLNAPLMRQLREKAREWWHGLFAVQSARGAWDQQTWDITPAQALADMPLASAPNDMLAVLTRASIKPAKAMAFWRFAPGAQADLEQAQGCEIAMGLGEAPLLRQCTFSLWQDLDCMQRYAHHDAHQQAIEAAYRHQFFSESLFVRMRLLSMQGNWKGHAHEYHAQPLHEAAA